MANVSDPGKRMDGGQIFVSREEAGSEADAFGPGGMQDKCRGILQSGLGGEFSNRQVADLFRAAEHGADGDKVKAGCGDGDLQENRST